MKKLINPIYKLLTRQTIYSQDKAVLERAWKNDYKPFGYKVLMKPTFTKTFFVGETYKMIVCKTLL